MVAEKTRNCKVFLAAGRNPINRRQKAHVQCHICLVNDKVLALE